MSDNLLSDNDLGLIGVLLRNADAIQKLTFECAPDRFVEISDDTAGMVVDYAIDGMCVEYHFWGNPDLVPLEVVVRALEQLTAQDEALNGRLTLNHGVSREEGDPPESGYHLVVRGFAITPDAGVARLFLNKLAQHLQ